MSIIRSVNQLLNYGLSEGLIQTADVDFVANQLMDLLQVDAFEFEQLEVNLDIDDILSGILDDAVEKKIIKNDTIDDRDLFDTKVMGVLVARPSEVNQKFADLYQVSPKEATDYFYQLSGASNYIRMGRIKKDQRWKVKTVYGELDVTINLSKPEKDPKTIALAKTMPSSGYPKCLLCKENVGYAGHLSHPARQNHRIIPVTLADEAWYLQYSPYVYYNEHSIILKGEHEPMVISRETFVRLFDFVKQFKHYFVGANADLPIVGGSILSHDHFQGGAYSFAMDHAEVLKKFVVSGFEGVDVEHLKWPLTTLRLKSDSSEQLIALADRVLSKWRKFSDPSLGIYAYTDDVPHNTITPIARFRAGVYELDLVLRNNRTSDEHPDGIYHPHEQYHHLKKENIGLIEVMGLAVLPGRLLTEIQVFKEALLRGDVTLLEAADLMKHHAWHFELVDRAKGLTAEGVDELIKESIGMKFAQILECCGVFKLNEVGFAGVERFMEEL